jgi:hypothetical protein
LFEEVTLTFAAVAYFLLLAKRYVWQNAAA